MVATATKAKPKAKARTVGFKQLVERLSKEEKFPSLLHTAVSTGWLTNEVFLTKLTAEEQSMLKELYKKHSKAKSAIPLDIEKVIPPMVGMSVKAIKENKQVVQLSSGDDTAKVSTELFNMLKKRHPNAMIYLAPNDPEENAVIFSEKTTVALLATVGQQKKTEEAAAAAKAEAEAEKKDAKKS